MRWKFKGKSSHPLKIRNFAGLSVTMYLIHVAVQEFHSRREIYPKDA